MRLLLLLAVLIAPAALPACTEGESRPAPPAASAWSAPAEATRIAEALGRGGQHRVADLVADGGRMHAVFVADRDGDGAGDAVLHAAREGGAWGPPEPVAETMSLVEAARVVVDGDGVVHVLWLEHRGGAAPRTAATDVMHRAKRGGRWTAAGSVYREPRPSGLPGLFLAAARGPRGEVHVAHTAAGRGFGHLVLAGGRWSAPRWLDQDGFDPAWAVSPDGSGMELAYVGDAVSLKHPRADNDLFVRALRGGAWTSARAAHASLGRYSHQPRLVPGAGGSRRLAWLEDLDGDVVPEALFLAASADGERWGAPEDVTPAALRDGILWSVRALPDGRGGVHLLVRHSRADRTGNAVHHLRRRADGAWDAPRVLVGAGRMGTGDALAVLDASTGRLLALWRGADGAYHEASAPR